MLCASNQRSPVSNLSFMSKLIERVVANQLHEYLSANNLLPRFQSAYRKGHSTETALLRVWSDMLMAADERKVTFLSLLNMSAAFDCVDHLILLQRLQVAIGIGGTALDWIRSFLSGRNPADRVRRRAIGYVGSAFRRSAGHSARTAAIRALHSTSVQRHRETSGQSSSIRWRSTAVFVRAADGSFDRCWPPRCVSCWCWSLAKSQPA